METLVSSDEVPAEESNEDNKDENPTDENNVKLDEDEIRVELEEQVDAREAGDGASIGGEETPREDAESKAETTVEDVADRRPSVGGWMGSDEQP